ncbi:hypothetical protein MMMB2_0179 [Mycobacterium marinum MB2]|nr:hypothetical protein MMMB2_0179 [Mycobacterium marinum MB2]
MLSTFPVVRIARCALVKAFVASSDCSISAINAGSAGTVVEL